ncbi:hypothetical protein ASA1KI_14340 [Opitutales bacterium ASA1]|uniref:sensor histidine kinase n=1 Tax=Congregicoccus parvus TaxID=3081749 RepID=UPI002B27D32B|nr:hypothetical protein ASA1KI_14340 [Opitutales bacterium ASA1]
MALFAHKFGSAGDSSVSVPGAGRRWWVTALLFVGFWSVLILAFAAQLVFTASFPWTQGIRGALFDWLPWVVLSPFVAWLAWRFPLEKGRLRWSIPVHAVATLLCLVASGFISHQLLPRPQGPWSAGRERAVSGESRPAPGAASDMPMPPREFGPRPVPRGDGGGDGAPGPMRSFGGPPDRPGASPFQMRGPPRDEGMRRFWTVVFQTRSKFNLPVYWVIVSVVHAFAFYRRVQDRDRRALELSASLSKAKLQALRLQMQPHFLFNTLNAISTLVHRDADKADEMIVNLSQLLRLSLEVTEQEMPLRHELEILDRYLEIEQVRLGDRLRVLREIEPAVLDALVPSLVIQTIVENAIRHGIEPRAAPGTVTLRARRDGDMLRLDITDDGIGLKPAERASERRGIGLSNTESRLAELYGGRARILLREPPEGGVSVEIDLPLRLQEDTTSGTARQT